MSMSRALVFLLLFFLPILNGCGGSPTPTAPTTSSGIVVSPGTAIITDEAGLAATLSISLATKPTADVTIPVSSSNPSAGTVDKDSLVFTSSNWATGQTITITGANGALTDGNQSYNILLGPAVSTDASYSGLQQYITATNLEVQAGSFVVSPISGNTWESGVTATFTVRLGSAPSSEVTLPVQSSDPTEGVVDKAGLTFTTLNWDQYQTVTVTGVDDAMADGDQPYMIQLGPAVSTDSLFNNLDPEDLNLTNLDVKTGLVEVTAISGDSDEAGGQATFQVKLLSQPAAEVTIPVSSSDLTEGTVNQANLTFTGTDWDQYQTVTVTGVADNLADGDIAYSILLGASASTDDNYNGLDPADVAVTNRDVRVGSFEITAISGNTNESGGQATFQVRLNSPPIADVTIPIDSSDLGEGTVDKSSLTFTTATWDAYQTVTVTGVDDNIADGDIEYDILLGAATSTDPIYSTLDPADLTVINLDVKTGGVTVSQISGYTDESGLTATFLVSLTSQPAADVTIPSITSSQLAEGTVSPASLTFTPGDWSARTVTVTGVDDDAADGNQAYSIILGATTSTDDNFDGLDPADVSMTNVDLVDPFGVTPRISAGSAHSLVLTSDGTVWGWGSTSGGRLPAAPTTCTGTSFDRPKRLNITGASAVSAGNAFTTIVRDEDGNTATTADRKVWTSGTNDSVILGRSGDATTLAPVDGLTDVKTVAAGTVHSLALKNNGEVWAWGKGGAGQLGNNGFADSQTPVLASGLSAITAIAAGAEHSLALVDSTGLVYSWGKDDFQQLGNGAANAPVGTPTQIPSWTGITAIGAGQTSSFAFGTYGTTPDTYAWGQNWDFVLGTSGTGTPTDLKNAPTPIVSPSLTNLVPIRKISANKMHALALSNESPPKVYSWGDNDGDDANHAESQKNFGALGNGNYTDRVVTSLFTTSFATGAVDIAAGGQFSLVLLNDGRMQSSGNALGDVLGTDVGLTLLDLGAGGLVKYIAIPAYVEDPAKNSAHFYAYRPILSGQPATSTTSTTTTINVCADAVRTPTDFCKGITHYQYSTDNDTCTGSWVGPYTTDTPITVTSGPGTVNLWVKGMKNITEEIQTNTSAAKVSWTVVAAP